ncbi:MAG: hypothetical protein H8E14_06550 [Candidatus Marinimicrobia bacterium]|nr:hypothetical protein [Candidatus Neomarinimicrobiota bacterium]
MQDNKFSLNGNWLFAIDPEGRFNSENVLAGANWHQVQVPAPWQTQHRDLREYLGIGWYYREFTAPALTSDQILVLNFNGVDWFAKIYVNGKLAGEHAGGYTTFSINIDRFLKSGTNEILVRVMDPADTEEGTEGVSLWQVPHGKQSWYVQNSGIWQGVEMVVRPGRHIRKTKITPKITGSVNFDFSFSPDIIDKNRELRLDIFDLSGSLVLRRSEMIPTETEQKQFRYQIDNPMLWSPESPSLYKTVIYYNSEIIEEKFGFREIRAENGRILLNGQPFYMRGALDQDFYPETQYSDPQRQYLRKGLENARAMGLNLVRYHVKIPIEHYLDLADEIGLMVWVDLPNWDVFTAAAAERGQELFAEWLDQDWNHPSLAIISLFNESWGIDLKQAEQRKWLKEFYADAKEKASDRLIIDNSACWGNYHLVTDINDYHTYWSIPENRLRFDETITELAGRPQWLFSPHGDKIESGQEPLILSEFGNWGLPEIPEELHWYLKKQFQDIDYSRPEGVVERFSEFGYDSIFPDFNALARATQHSQFAALKYEIESLRLKDNIQGYVITELTDINWEVNGLMSIWREPKLYFRDLANLQTPVVLVPRPEKYTCRSGDTVVIDLSISNFSNQDLENCKLRWWILEGESHSVSLVKMNRYSVSQLSSVRILVPDSDELENMRVNFELTSDIGNINVLNYTELTVVPVEPINSLLPELFDPCNLLSNLVGSQANVQRIFPDNPAIGGVLITDSIDDSIRKFLERGGNVFCLLTGDSKIPDDFPMALTAKESEGYDGNWISNFNWIRKGSPPFRGIATEGLLDFEMANLTPEVVLTGIAADYFEDVLAGMFVGWLHLNSGYVVQARIGQGRLLLCTWDLLSNLNTDPIAQYFFNKLVTYLSGEEFSTGLVID